MELKRPARVMLPVGETLSQGALWTLRVAGVAEPVLDRMKVELRLGLPVTGWLVV
jgi:hypothetical protein